MNFCTLFNSGKHALEGWVMAYTLFMHNPSVKLYVLCMDDLVYSTAITLSSSYNIVAIHFKDVERRWPELVATKNNRKIKEYIVSFKPFLPQYLFETCGIENVIFIDADIAFWGNTSLMFELFNSCSFFAKDHEIDPPREAGKFNVGLLGFKNDDKCLDWLKWWQKKCIEWCFWYADNGRFAEQGYWNILHDNPSRFSGFLPVEHPGVNLAPWNISKHLVDVDNDGNLLVDGKKLIAYHYHEFELRGSGYFPTGWALPPNAKTLLYDPYYKLICKSINGHLWAKK